MTNYPHFLQFSPFIRRAAGATDYCATTVPKAGTDFDKWFGIGFR